MLSNKIVKHSIPSLCLRSLLSQARYMSNWATPPKYFAEGGNTANSFPSNNVTGFPQRRKLPLNTIVKFVPQQEAWVVERMGRFDKVLEPGLCFLIPFLDRIRYVQVLKELAVAIPTQTAITQDNVTLRLDGVLYYKVVDPYKASYGVEDAHFSIAQLAQTTMRAEIGQMTLDLTLAERNRLNANIVEAINAASESWGIRCLRYEIRDIHPPENVVQSMHSLVSAERSKRAQILESEGRRQAEINVAEGHKQAVILESEATKSQQINHATGDAEAILLKAKATALGLEKVAEAIQKQGGPDAVSLTIAEQYVAAFGQLAQKGTTVIVPASANDIGGMVAQALTITNKLSAALPTKVADQINLPKANLS